jgi:hypothetical protein
MEATSLKKAKAKSEAGRETGAITPIRYSRLGVTGAIQKKQSLKNTLPSGAKSISQQALVSLAWVTRGTIST